MKPYNALFVAMTTPDTTTNTDTSYLVIGPVSPSYSILFQWTSTKISGTPGGYAIFQGSEDKVNWYNLSTNKVESPVLTDSVTILNGTTLGIFSVQNHNFLWYRLRDITSGTQRATITGTAWLQKLSFSSY
jgi:hypothetical protein